MLDAKLVVVGGDAKAAEVRLKLPTIIGRGKEAGLTVPHALVSRRHTEIFEQDGGLYVRDLGSLNGTFVNNLRIENDQPLEPNQLLTLGNVTFRAVYEKQTDGANGSITKPSEETVTFEEVNTTEEMAASKQSPAIASVPQTFTESPKTPKVADVETPSEAVVTFDETVHLDSLPKKEAPEKVAKEIKVEKSKPADPELAKNEKPAKEEACPNTVELEEPKSSADDTDKSFTSSEPTKEGEGFSSIFNFDETENPSANKSISASSLDDLPTGPAAAVSFVGGIDLGEDAPQAAASQIDPIEIELGAEKKSEVKEEDSSLGSFLNKLPR